MAEPATIPWSDAERRYADAMRAEVDWAPLHFDGWSRYEQARPFLPGETIEVLVRWPEQGYSLQYRPELGELTQARQLPIDPFPEVTVLGRVDEGDLSELRSVVPDGINALADAASHLAKTDRTIPIEPPVPTGSSIPEQAESPVHYVPAGGRWLEQGRLIHEEHPSAAYAVAGHWGIRLGPPLGITPTGLLVFQPVGTNDLRITVEHPVSQPAGPRINEARVGVYRHDGLGAWRESAMLNDANEFLRMGPSSRSSMPHELPAPSHVVDRPQGIGLQLPE